VPRHSVWHPAEPRGPRSPIARRVTACLAVLIVAFGVIGAPARPAVAQVVEELQIHSEQYIVIDASTGEVFAQRAATDHAAMASLTKVFTAIQAIEEAPPDYVIVIDESDMPDPRASFMGFEPGETYTLEELLHGLMLPSGNDAAHAIARSLGTESQEDTPQEAVNKFVARMNQRIQDLGLKDTHLVNPDGWGVPGHYTTPRDLAAFIRYALQFPRFVELISSESYTLSDGRELYNNNRMMSWYPDLVGGKTGYDDDAGWCLIEVAERDGETMISVTFDGIHENQDWYDDNRVLLEYGFEQKTDRLAAGRDVIGDVVSFLDPDAAVISRTASSDASIGQPPVSGGIGGSDAPPVAASVFGTMAAEPRRPVGGATTAALFAVVGLVLAARAMGTFAQPGRRLLDPLWGDRARSAEPTEGPTETAPAS
jgi:serine-type D-Ala-D-Ala carboxypeptidase (penicillin-binding protein 5/6)